MSQDELKVILNSLVEEIKTRNELEYSPIIKASLEAMGPLAVDLVVQNVGKVAAVDVQLEFWIEPSDFKKVIHYPLLTPGQKIKFFLPETNMKVLAEKFKFLKVKGKCRNIFDKTFEIETAIDLKRVLGSWIEGKIILEYTVEDRLRQLVDKIDRVQRSLDRMQALTRGVLVKTPSDEKKEIEERRKLIEERRAKEKAEEKVSSE